MKSLSSLWSTLCTILFFAGVVWSAYTLYQLPQDLMENVKTIDLLQIRQVQPLLTHLHLVIGGTFAVAMVTIVTLYISRSKQTFHYGSQNSDTGAKESAEKDVSDLNEVDSIQITGIDEIVECEDEKTLIFNRALSTVCKQLEASQAAAYQVKNEGKQRMIELFASFAHHIPEGEKLNYRFGEGLAGQVAKEGKLFNIKSVPESYIQIISGLGKATPSNLIIIPVKADEKVVGVVEIASFKEFTRGQEIAIQQAFDKLALKLANNDNVSLAKAKS